MAEDFIAYKRTSKVWNMDRYHFHEQYEILLSLSENAEMFVTDRCYPLQYGSLILLTPAVLHRSVSKEDQQYNRYVIRFPKQYAETLSSNSTNLLRAFSSGRVHFQLLAEQTEQLIALYEECLVQRTGYGADLKRRMAFTNLVLYVEEVISRLSGDLPERQDGLGQAISEILDYIPDHLRDDLSLEALSARFFISKPHMSRMFREYTGFSPGDFIIKARIMHARTLLRQGKSVMEACEGSGFRSYAHFIRTFRQLVGMSPGKYKNMYSHKIPTKKEAL